MKERFAGETGQRLLLEVLKTQKMVAGNQHIAEKLAQGVEVVEVRAGERIIHQGAFDNDIFFILAGSFDIVVHGKVVARRGRNDHVGEMAAIEPAQARSATVIANEDALVGRLTEAQLVALGQQHGEIWRYFAQELVHRLSERNTLVNPAHQIIRVFVMSSSEALDTAYALKNNLLCEQFFIDIWADGAFKVSNYALECLEEVVDASDFAIAIAQPDDFTHIRGQTRAVPRDNVIFELGFFIGRLGRKRTLLLEPHGYNVKLPTDLSGLMTLGYRHGKAEELPAFLAPACEKIRKIIAELGVYHR